MRTTGAIPGVAAIMVLLLGCSQPVVEHDLVSGGPSFGPPAVLDYKYAPMTLSGVNLVEVDWRQVDTGFEKEYRQNLFKLAPGTHTIRFLGKEGWTVRPEVVAFEAKPGTRYTTGFERVNFRSTEGATATLYFNFVSPVIFEVREGKPAKIVGAPATFKSGLDAEKNVLLYEDPTLPKERTAQVFIPRHGLGPFVVAIAGTAGGTRVEYQRSKFDLSQYYGELPGSWPDPWKLRLLPGEYQFRLTLDPQSRVPGAATAQQAAMLSGQKSCTLRAEPGRTYRINANFEVVDHRMDITNTSITITNLLRWNPVFEDVTGRGSQNP